MQGTKDNPAQQFTGDTKELVRQVNVRKKTRAKRKNKGEEPRGLTAEHRAKLHAQRVKFDSDRRSKVEQTRYQHKTSCGELTARQARKKLRLGKKWSQEKMEQAALDERVRSSSALGGNCQSRSKSGGHKGPFKGPSNRPPGLSNERWRNYLSGKSSTL